LLDADGSTSKTTFWTLGLQLKNCSVAMTRDTQSTVRNPANGERVPRGTAGCVSDTRGETTVPNKRVRNVRTPKPKPVPVPSDNPELSDVFVPPDPADVSAFIAELIGSDPDTLIGTIPADVPADIPAIPAVPVWITAFGITFPGHVGSVPAWIDPMCRTFDAVWRDASDTDRNAITFDAWITRFHAADPTDRPARGHRYTMGSGSDIARTQNAIYIGIMLIGIPWKRVPVAFGAAAWRFVLGSTKCDYRDHADYFVSTFGRYVAHDHNDTIGIVNVDAENAARAWRDAKPEPEPEPADTE
jgi:hypothetical protein